MIVFLLHVPFLFALLLTKSYQMKLTHKNKRLTLAQVLMTFYHMVEHMNEYNKIHRPLLILDEYLMGDLRKELRRMSCYNNYMNAHIHDHIDVINDRLKETMFLEHFITTTISNKYKTIFLTYEDWSEIWHTIDMSTVCIKQPFRKRQIRFM